MKKNRIIFYLIFSLYQLIVLFFTGYVEWCQKENISGLTNIYMMIEYLKYGAMIGILFIIIDVIWAWQVTRKFNKEREAFMGEINILKAQMYDMQKTHSEEKKEEEKEENSDDSSQ